MRYVAVIIGLFAFLAAAQPALARDHGRDNGWGGGGFGGQHFARSDHHMDRGSDRPRMERDEGRRSERGEGRHWERGERPSLDRFLPGIRRQHPGRLLDVQRGWGPRGDRNRIKWLTPDGRVIWLDTDARTGEIYGVEGDEPHERWR